MLEITEALVSSLVADQFPEWADLPVRTVARQGWDNRTFRLGERLSVRLPSAAGYVATVEKEARTLRFLDGRLPVAIPTVVAVGTPGSGYPFPWSVRRWLPGEPLDQAADRERASIDPFLLAGDVATFLRVLRSLPTAAGSVAGRHSFLRGCHPSVYANEVEIALDRLGSRVDVTACRRIWNEAISSVWTVAPVWFHGDVAAGNLLVRGGRLRGVIDFGTCGVGDPACDLVLAWTWFRGPARETFRETVGLDPATWARARGWALWKALATLSGQSSPDTGGVQFAALDEVLADDL